MAELKDIGKALEAYAREHEAALPNNLEDLVPRYLADKRTLIDAESGQKFVFVGRGQLCSAMVLTNDFDVAVVYSPTWGNSRHGIKGRNVLFNDGHVQRLEPNGFEAALRGRSSEQIH